MQTAMDTYYSALRDYDRVGAAHETAVRSAMQNLLTEAGKEKGWTLVPERVLPNGKRPDGTFVDEFRIPFGYWEAKDTRDDLRDEVRKKFALGYPRDNMLFEDTRTAFLFQGPGDPQEYDLRKPDELRAMLRQMMAYQAPDYERFHDAINAFKEQIPSLAEGLRGRIAEGRDKNPAFVRAFTDFAETCRVSLDPNIRAETIEEMLIQHLLTERLFRTIFDNPDFTRRNVIASEIERVIDALTSRSFSKASFMGSLDRYYGAIEGAAKGITDWNEKQTFLNMVYERFFQGFSTKTADTHGIVYTPVEIVNFMLASTEHILQTEFGSSLSTPGVKILDPCTGTGNFLVHLLKHHLTRRDMRRKYTEDLFANEIMLLPYYIASLNIEHEYFALTGEYTPFPGLCFADTLALAEGEQTAMLFEANAERVSSQRKAEVTVIIGNPPYNVGQKSENDNNKNRAYKVVDNRIAATYGKLSKATNRNALSDAYVKFFRWASDRLQGRDGVIAFVSNNGFLDGIATDGMRKALLDEFTTIYHLDCGGNVRKFPKLSGTTHNVFSIQVGVGVTLLVRRHGDMEETLPSVCRIFHHALPTMARASERLQQLTTWKNSSNVPWMELIADFKGNWLTEGMHSDFDDFLPIGAKENKSSAGSAGAIFSTYTIGVKTNRDEVVYDFDSNKLANRTKRFIEAYNAEVDRYKRAGSPNDIDNFVSYDIVNWSRDLKSDLKRGRYAQFDNTKLRSAMYRPFSKRMLFFDAVLCQDLVKQPLFFPKFETENDNTVICVRAIGNTVPFHCIATNRIADLHFTGDSQCFPFYVYNADGTERRENITNDALRQFRDAHGETVSKWDIFHYVYARLHDPAYRERYAENLRRELPRIPISSH
ncbi:MAG: N-6 DNA methylase, partial [Fibrella sp.]|nr:N-6 DNA methylase [Armatimonadota bacterium]